MSLSLGPYSRIGFSVAALLAVIILVWLYLGTPASDRARAAGNLLSRLMSARGVVDFICIRTPS